MRRLLRAFGWFAFVLGCALAAGVVALRFWLLPNIDDHRAAIARELSAALRQHVEIGHIALTWSGLQPHVTLTDVQLLDNHGGRTLAIKQIDNSLPWRSLLRSHWQLDSFRIKQLELVIRRDPAGDIVIAGYSLREAGGDTGIGAWLLRQPAVAVDDAVVIWHDELRAAPPLRFTDLGGLLENDGERHRFQVHAAPPAALGAAVELRGELWREARATATDDRPGGVETDDGISNGGDNGGAQWRGSLYLKTDRLEVPALASWLTLPESLVGGSAAVTAWLSIAGARIEHAVIDGRAAGLTVRLARNLDQMDFPTAQGRMIWDLPSRRFELAVPHAEFKNDSGERISASLHMTRIDDPQRPIQQSTLQVDQLALDTAGGLLRRLPLADALSEHWRGLHPRGVLAKLAIDWDGAWPQPERYRIEADVRGLALSAVGKAPAVSGVSGHLKAEATKGSLQLDSNAAEISLPAWFANDLRFDRLSGELAWTLDDGFALEFKELAFANAHLAGSASGSYRAAAGKAGNGGRGVLDLSAQLARADLRFAARYTPLAAGDKVRNWLGRALHAGSIERGSLRLQGDLDGFPFADGGAGMFEARANVVGATIDYAESWPQAAQVSADLLVRGRRMEIEATDGDIAGVRLSAARAIIPALGNGDEMLRIHGEADGPSARFIRLIESSPLARLTLGRTRKLAAEGDGKLVADLVIPLRRKADTRVSGDYAFVDNKVSAGTALPPLDNATGKIEFSNGEVSARNVAASIKGNTVTLNFVARAGGPPAITLNGRSTAAEIQNLIGIHHSWLSSVRGASDWRAQLRLKPGLAEWSVQSDLAGIASELPAPFGKAAADKVPLRIAGEFAGELAGEMSGETAGGAASGNGRQLSIDYGDVIHADLVLDQEGARTARGHIRLGKQAASSIPAASSQPPPPRTDGISASGSLPRFDVDAWRRWLAESAAAANADDSAIDKRLQLDRLNVHFDELIAFNRRFTDLRLDARADTGGWQAQVSAKELAGDLNWQAADEHVGKSGERQVSGKVTARLQRLALPDAVDADNKAARENAAQTAHPRRLTEALPAIDLTIEDLRVHEVALGEFALRGQPEGKVWRIERLHLRTDSAELEADGFRQAGEEPRTQLKINLQIDDVGAFFKRMDFPDGIKEGRATLAGVLSWSGDPLELSYAKLSGNLVLRASDGSFAKIEPGLGIGKLLAVLSLQNLPRRLALDFDDVFAKGYAFDEIAADVDIERGVANSDEFVIRGPAAKTVLSGEVDLVAETQKLYVKVTPALSDSLSVATLLVGGPVIGLTSYVLQKVLQDPLGKLTTHRYEVTGTWLAPTLSPVNEAAVAR